MDFVPEALSGPNFPAITNFNPGDLSQLALAAPGTSPYKATYSGFAPRLGFAYRIRGTGASETVVRAGGGIFNDLASAEAGNIAGGSYYPFGSISVLHGGNFPFGEPPQPAPISPANLAEGVLFAFDPRLRQPYTIQWNLALEQALGDKQMVSASYVGARGRQLLQMIVAGEPNPQFFDAILATNAGTSDYHSVQLQFQHRLAHGIQALASYTLAHSIDTGSAGSYNNFSDLLVPGGRSTNRGPSDFDIRHTFSAALALDVPSFRMNRLVEQLTAHWAIDTIFYARSAAPVDVFDANFSQLSSGLFADVRPDIVPGQPLYLHSSSFPGDKALNPAAFADPPFDPDTGNALRQGTAARNMLRGFGATQCDLAAHRNFPLWESIVLQFRAEMFNVTNRPNFGPPNGGFGTANFGQSRQILSDTLNGGNLGGGGLSSLYQIGGPRSIQLALKLLF